MTDVRVPAAVTPCPLCGCTVSTQAHVILAALRDDDLDRALDDGLLDAVPCTGCADTCAALLLAARDARRTALDARERYRARDARLTRRNAERDAQRAASARLPAALPPAAAAALARARAKAGQR